MKVLITGKGSYIGSRIADYLAMEPETFEVQELDLRDGVNGSAFYDFDAVIHVAGIAHQKETEANAALYRMVNRDLAVMTASAAKAHGVKQFVFFSSMSVYGMTTGEITMQTQPSPNTHYGVSKWEAEQELDQLRDEQFHIAVLRPPMIYGRGCRGNYPRLSALAQSLPLFPYVDNARSMLYIDVLCAFVRKLLLSGKGGLYFPQNREYVSTCELVKEVAYCHNKPIRMVRGFGWLIRLAAKHIGLVGKVFGSLTYDQSMSESFRDANEPDFARTIRMTEVGR